MSAADVDLQSDLPAYDKLNMLAVVQDLLTTVQCILSGFAEISQNYDAFSSKLDIKIDNDKPLVSLHYGGTVYATNSDENLENLQNSTDKKDSLKQNENSYVVIKPEVIDPEQCGEENHGVSFPAYSSSGYVSCDDKPCIRSMVQRDDSYADEKNNLKPVEGFSAKTNEVTREIRSNVDESSGTEIVVVEGTERRMNFVTVENVRSIAAPDKSQVNFDRAVERGESVKARTPYANSLSLATRDGAPPKTPVRSSDSERDRSRHQLDGTSVTTVSTENAKRSNPVIIHGQKLYLCDYCNKPFQYLAHKKSHERIHTGEKPYTCPHCKRKFSYEHNMKAHMVTHTGERPFVCRYCGKAYAYQNKRRVHELTHTGERPYACRCCNKTFPNQTKRLEHELAHHSRENP